MPNQFKFPAKMKAGAKISTIKVQSWWNKLIDETNQDRPSPKKTQKRSSQPKMLRENQIAQCSNAKPQNYCPHSVVNHSTVTLVLYHFLISALNRFFPKIFGKTEDLPLDFDGSWAAFKKLTEEVVKKSVP